MNEWMRLDAIDYVAIARTETKIKLDSEPGPGSISLASVSRYIPSPILHSLTYPRTYSLTHSLRTSTTSISIPPSTPTSISTSTSPAFHRSCSFPFRIPGVMDNGTGRGIVKYNVRSIHVAQAARLAWNSSSSCYLLPGQGSVSQRLRPQQEQADRANSGPCINPG